MLTMGSFKILSDPLIGALIIFLTASLICAQNINNEADFYEMNVLNNRYFCSAKNLINPPLPFEEIKVCI